MRKQLVNASGVFLVLDAMTDAKKLQSWSSPSIWEWALLELS
jgi:hypothetical protein